jgi:crossover junction endodeoxyribonuclease RuvC
MNKNDKYRILGVDPGTNFLGYAILEVEGKSMSLITMSVITLSHVDEQAEKLKRIYDKMRWVIDTYSPAIMAIEQPFYAKNVQSMLKLGRAQGVAIAAALAEGLTVEEYLPKVVKKSVAGNGNAAKEQVAAMLGHVLKRPIEPSFFDASDALAVAVCHFYQSNRVIGGKKRVAGWAQFLSSNPDRVLK